MAKKETKKTEDDASVNIKESKSAKASKESKPEKTTKKKEAKSKTIKEDLIATIEVSKHLKTEKSSKKFLKEFDWHNYEEGIEKVDEKKLKNFDKLVKENFVETLTNEVVEGTVVHMTERDAIIDINAKSEGVISLNEFRYNQDIAYFDPPLNSLNKLTCSIYDAENATAVSTLPIQLKLEFVVETKDKMRIY